MKKMRQKAYYLFFTVSDFDFIINISSASSSFQSSTLKNRSLSMKVAKASGR